jgi:polyvinyl alcohol dehydrogenase (cytochrome)
LGGHDPGAVTSANGVVFAGSAGLPPIHVPGFDFDGTTGGFFALNGSTGAVLWSFPIDGAVNSGPSVVDGVVYWGSGYSHLANAFGRSGGSKLYAFALK